MLLSNTEHFHKPYLFIPLDTGKGQNFMDTFESILQSGNSVDVKNDDSIIEDIHWIMPFIDVRNDEQTPKNGDFFLKKDETIL